MRKTKIGFIVIMLVCLALSAAACGGETAKPDEAATALSGELSTIGTVTLEDEDYIADLRARYDELSDTAKRQVTNYEILTAAEGEIVILKTIDALTPTFTSAVTMRSGSVYTPALSGHEPDGVTAQVTYTLTETGDTGAVLSNGTVTATGLGAFTLEAAVTYPGHSIDKKLRITVAIDGYTVSGAVTLPARNADLMNTVSVATANGAYVGQVDADGGYEIGVPAGVNYLVFSARGLKAVTQVCTVVDSDVTLDAAFTPTTSILPPTGRTRTTD